MPKGLSPNENSESKNSYSFLIFGLIVGIWSFRVGQRDLVAGVNFPGSYVSEIVYNKYLIPYWELTLEPTGYEHIPIRDLLTGKVVGLEDVPIYDFPLNKVSDLYIPASVVSWGLIGLVIQLIYNAIKRFKGSLRGAKSLFTN